MKLKLYLPSGYIDWNAIFEYAKKKGLYFIYTWGGRGSGKTYGMLKYLAEQDEIFIHMRRTEKTLTYINKPELSDYTNKINPKEGTDLIPKMIAKPVAGYYHMDEEGKATGSPVGYTAALNTFAKLRSVGGLDLAKKLFYDEFIPQLEEKAIMHEGSAFMNLLETVNRNRELEGEEPLIICGCSNSNDIANPIFMELRLVEKVARMVKREIEVLEIPERKILLINFEKSPISQKKGETALYQTNVDSDFARMALGNKFAYNDMSDVQSENLSQYKPVVAVGECVFYRHKSGNGQWYVSFHLQGSPEVLNPDTIGFERFKKNYRGFIRAYIANKVIFENYTCKSMTHNILGIKR